MKHKVLTKMCLFLAMFFALSAVCAGCDWPWENIDASPSEQTYTVTYADNTGIHSFTVQYGKTYFIDTVPQQDGYRFLGLFDAKIGGTQYIDADGLSLSAFKDREDKRLYPHWEPKEYTLLLNYGEASSAGVTSVPVSYDGLIQGLPDNLYLEGASFLGWYNAQETTGTKFANGMVMDKSLAALADPSDRISLYALFETAKYTVRFYSFDGTALLAEKQVPHGTDLSMVAPKTLPNGSEILGWSTSQNGYGNEFMGPITDHGTFYVKYYNCTLTIDPANGSQNETVTVRNGEPYILKQLSRTGYDFLGWDDGTGNLRIGSITPTQNMTLTAKWQAIKYTVQLSVSQEEGTVSTDSKTVTFGSSFNLPVPRSLREDYKFEGWYSDDGKKLTDENGNGLSKWNIPNDMTATARFKQIEYTVSFEANGGTYVGAKTVFKGQTIDLPSSSKTGYTFNCWKTSSGTKVSSPYKPTGNVTLYADWSANSYTITLNPNGGSVEGSTSTETTQVTYGTSFSLPVPTRDKYEFVGWYTSTDSTGARQTNAQGNSVSIWDYPGSTTLFAIWTTKYEITLDRASCKDGNGYDPSSGGSEVDSLAHHNWNILDLVIGGCTQGTDGSYFIPEGNSLSISFQVLQNIGALPTWDLDGKSVNWTKHWMNSDSYSGNVYGTNLNNQTVGMGAYYVKITYTDNSSWETNRVDFLNGAKKGDIINVPLNLNANKKIKSFEVVAVYELFYDYMDSIWNWGGTQCTANWRCSGSIEFS